MSCRAVLCVGTPPGGLECAFSTDGKRLLSVLGQSYRLDQKTEQSELQPKIRYVLEENNAHLVKENPGSTPEWCAEVSEFGFGNQTAGLERWLCP